MSRRIHVILFVACLLLALSLARPQGSGPGPARGSRSEQVGSGNAAWIWPANASRTSTVYLRQSFDLSTLPESARLRVAAHGRFTVYVNGASVMESMGSEVTQALWVTRYLRDRRNVLAVECRPSAGNAVGILFDLMIRYRDGRTSYVVSNGDEKTAVNFHAGWQQPEYNDRAWLPARVTGRDLSSSKPGGAITPGNRAGRAIPRGQIIPRVPQPVSYDFSRLVRVWDIYGSGQPNVDPYIRPRETGERMLVAAHFPPAVDLAPIASAGFTLYRVEGDYLSTEETSPGVWDFTRLETALRQLGARGLDGALFPHFAFPPKWYREQIPFTRIRCLEHDKTVEAFSPWEPKYTAYLNRAYSKLGERLSTRIPGSRTRQPGGGASVAPRALFLGIHGDYGEAGLLTGARAAVPEQREDWQRRFGSVHDHSGWWCADKLARENFRERMFARYQDLDVLNAVWRTKFRKTEEIAYPTGPNAGSRRYWLDFVNWYLNSTSNLADMVARIARRSYPDTPLIVPVGGGDENPRSGTDISTVAKLASKHGLELCSTHGGFLPFAQNQAGVLGRIASACRFYRVPLWTEPSGRVTADGQAERVFAAVSLGSKGYVDRPDNIRDTRDAYYRLGKYMRVEKPVVDVAMFFPTTSHLLRPDQGYPAVLAQGCAAIRDVLNYDFVDEQMVRDGALDRYRVLALWEGTVVEKETLEKIREWVQSGGVLVAYDFGKIETVEGDSDWFADMFGFAGRLKPAQVGPATADGRAGAAIDLNRLRSEWARPYGRGWTVFFPATRRNLVGYYEVLRYLTYHLSDLDSGKRDAIAVDDAWDGIYATLLGGRAIYYNPTAKTVTRTIVLSPSGFASRSREVVTPRDFTHTISLEPHDIGQISFENPPEEMLFQCEKFTDPGRLRPSEGVTFSPGRGLTHILVPTGGQIGTRFECDTPGRYRVLYRTTRNSRLTTAEVTLDGKKVESRESGDVSRVGMLAQTREAGTVMLTKGIHAMTLRPRRGEDMRADFVILTSDPTIAGYSFAVR